MEEEVIKVEEEEKEWDNREPGKDCVGCATPVEEAGGGGIVNSDNNNHQKRETKPQPMVWTTRRSTCSHQ